MQDERENKLVLPGDFISTSEEFLAGEGTYDEDGSICAATVGTVNINAKEKMVAVNPKINAPPVSRLGDIVVGRVTDVKGSIALVDIARIKGHEDREIANPEKGAIHISNVKEAYVSDLSYEFGYGDIVKAKVIDVKSMRLTTVSEEFGVIKAICPQCKVGLTRKDNKLECPRCEGTYTRKISSDYGAGSI